MKHHISISSLLFCGFLIFLAPYSPVETKVCGEFRNKKLRDALFQDSRVLSLNCDSTFSYKHSNCIHPEISTGTWSLSEGIVKLSVSNKVKRLAGKERKTKAGYRSLDLDGGTLTINDFILIWKRSNDFVDTLYRQ